MKRFEVIEDKEWLWFVTYNDGGATDYIWGDRGGLLVNKHLCNLAAGYNPKGGDTPHRPTGTTVLDNDGIYWERCGPAARRELGRLTVATLMKLTGGE